MAKNNPEPAFLGPLAQAGAGPDRDLEQIRQAVKGIRFGEVRVVIQDGVIVQIDRLEKQRLR